MLKQNSLKSRTLQILRSRRAATAPVVALIVGAAGLTGCHKRNSDASKYETVPITRGALTAKVTASGTLSALVTVTIGAQVSGRIEKLMADYNSKVTKGELLAQIDPLLFQAALDQQEADIVSAKAQIATALATQKLDQLTYDRDTKLFEQKLLPAQTHDTDQANLDIARAAVETGRGNLLLQEAQVRTARANLYYTKITSPIDGVVVSRSVDVGQTVVSSYQAPALFTIAQDLQKMQVDTNVAESDIGHIQPGTRAVFMVDAYPGERFKGRIRQIRVAPQTVQNVVTYDVVIDVDNNDLRLLPGMTATAEFITNHHDDVLKVSNAALRFHPPPGLLPPNRHHGTAEGKGASTGHEHEARAPDRKDLWVLRDGHPVMVAVQVGLTDGHETEIISTDLHEGDSIISGLSTEGTSPAHGGMRRIF